MVPACLDVVNAAIFPSPKPSYSIDDFEEELIWVPKGLDPKGARPEDCVPCLLLSSPAARFFILYLHSNAEDLGRCYKFCSLLRHFFHANVLAVEYPGYGVCPGRADEDSVVENARVGLRFLMEVLHWPLDGILLFGRSVGCGPALALAVEQAVYGVILVAPFTSIRDLCREFLGSVADFIGERFPNLERIQRIRSPLLLIHGQKDSMIPCEHGRALFEACKSRKLFVSPEHMDHNAYLYTDAGYLVLPMLHFFGMPDYDFGEMTVPEWVFDKRLSPLCSEQSHLRRPSGEFQHFRIIRSEEEEGLTAAMATPSADRAPELHEQALGRCAPPVVGIGRSTGDGGHLGPLPCPSPAKESQAELASLPESEGSTAVSDGAKDLLDAATFDDIEDEGLPVVAVEAIVVRPASRPRVVHKESNGFKAIKGKMLPGRRLTVSTVRPLPAEGDRDLDLFGDCSPFGSPRGADDGPTPPEDPSPVRVPHSRPDGPQLLCGELHSACRRTGPTCEAAVLLAQCPPCGDGAHLRFTNL